MVLDPAKARFVTGRRLLAARGPLIAHAILESRGVRPAIFVITLLVIAWNVARKLGSMRDFGLDAHAYWAVNLAEPYRLTAGTPDAFLYSPPFVDVFSVLQSLPWPVFQALWLVVTLAALTWLAREWTLQMLALPPVFNEVFFGNINLLLALAIVVGLRRPAAWAFIILTKVTPGMGLIWFAVRREWRSLAIAVGVTAAIVVTSFALTPDLWFDWFRSLRASSAASPSATSIAIPLVPRLGVALVLLIWGGMTGRRWVLPLAVLLSLPVLWSASLSILVALVPILRPTFRRWLRRARAARLMTRARSLVASESAAHAQPGTLTGS